MTFLLTAWVPFEVYSWWRRQMETVSAARALCAGNSPANGEFPLQRPMTQNFDMFFDLRLNKRLSKQSRRRWFETPLRPLWRYCNVADSMFMHTEADMKWPLFCRPRFEIILSNANCCIPIQFSLWFSSCSNNNRPALIKIMTWCRWYIITSTNGGLGNLRYMRHTTSMNSV